MKRLGLARLWLLLLVALGVGLAGCQRAEPTSDVEPAAVVDPTLLAFLSRARAAHHVADIAEEQALPDKAIDALRGLVSGPLPGGSPPAAPEVREVLADTHARLADLESRRGLFEQAERDLASGLALAEETTYFRGHLFEVRGLVEERRGKALEAAGKPDEASAAKQRALEAFEQSMDIQAEVIRKAVQPGTPEGGER